VLPLSMSAWVTVYTTPVQPLNTTSAPGARLDKDGQDSVGSNGSVTTTLNRVTLPVFCTENV
jgi:hypothetical protein